MENYIDSPEALQTFCDTISGSPWLTIDTEFIREKTYFPQLCLIQIANAQTVSCIDIIALSEHALKPLFEILYDSKILKIFHAGGQDMEIFYHIKGQLPTPVFDTQIAAAFLNYGEQISYAELVHTLTGTKLDKAHTRANWAKRPLSEQEIQYALDDVRYLRDTYALLKDHLLEKNRLDWLEHDLNKLSDPKTYHIDPKHVWQRVKHCKKLSEEQLPILQALAAWREHYAIELDKPRRWVLADETLIELCKTAPDAIDKLEAIEGISKNLLRRQGDKILSSIKTAQQLPKTQWPNFKQRDPLTPEQKSTIQYLSSLVKEKSQILSINSTMLATRKDLEKLVLGKRNLPILSGWRFDVIGKTMLQYITNND